MSVEDLEIISGDEVKNQLTPAEFNHLLNLWIEETYEPIESPKTIARERIGKTLGLDEDNERIQAEEKARLRGWEERTLKEALEKGDMVIAKKEGRVVGMVRVYKLDHVGTNPFITGDVYEIGKALTIPEERGQGVYRKVREQALIHLREKYGDVPILTGTREHTIKKINREDGWQEIGFEGYLQIYGNPEEYIESRRENIHKKGWTAFLHVPEGKSKVKTV